MKTKTHALLLAATIVLTTIGCSADQKTQKQQATEKWNATRATVLCSLAGDQYKSGNLDKCEETLRQALQMDALNPKLHVMAARVDIEQGRLESAERRLKTAAELAPNEGEIDYLQGIVQQRWQRPEAALACYESAVAKRNDDPAFLIAQAEMLVELNRKSEALKLLLDRVVYFEHSAAIRDAIGQLYEQSEQYADAVEYYRQAVVLDPDEVGTRERLGLLLYRGGEYPEALTQFRRILKSPDMADRIDLQLMVAECLLQNGLVQDARQQFDVVTTAKPTSTSAWLGVARSSLKIGDIRRAELAAMKAVALDPRSGETQMILGYVRVKQGRLDDAMACFNRASKADKDDSVSLSMMGMLLEKQGRSSDAVAMYRRALSIDPHDELAAKLMADAAVASVLP